MVAVCSPGRRPACWWGGAADLALAFTVMAPGEGRGAGLALVMRR
jgi:hypothetical protein